MRTYQDLLACGENEKERKDFILTAINEYKSSDGYQYALVAQEYAKKKNVTITNYRKLLYTIEGVAVPDNYSANHKCASAFFPKFIAQEVQYLLGNGADFENTVIKEKLSRKEDFDNILQEATRYALIDGVCYGFFNVDSVNLFRATEFVPLFDEEDGSIKAGIRWWQIDNNKPLRCTLFELDGYTDYIKRIGENEELEILRPKRAYKLNVRVTENDGAEIYKAENYPTFPIVPLYGNFEKQSELVGLKEIIDCYDLILSGFANDIDEASMLYWTLENCGGMDDIDLVNFKQRMSTIKVANLENGDSGAKAESHAIDVPYESRKVYLEILSKRLYDNAMAFDPEIVISGGSTATQIKAAYTNLNLKCNELEYCVNKFIVGLEEVAGIDIELPTYQRDNIINQLEETEMIINASEYLDDEAVINNLPFLTPEEKDALLERRIVAEANRYKIENAQNAQVLNTNSVSFEQFKANNNIGE